MPARLKCKNNAKNNAARAIKLWVAPTMNLTVIFTRKLFTKVNLRCWVFKLIRSSRLLAGFRYLFQTNTCNRAMPSSGKARSKRHKWIVAVVLVAVILLASGASYVMSSQSAKNGSPQTPEGLATLANHYMSVMQNLNSSQTETVMLQQLNPSFNQTDLFGWEHSKLTFATDPAGFFENPTQILASGKGICVQWSIVYVAACLALGYQSRLVAAVDTASWNYIHMWAEDFVGGKWVHVDPSDSVWNNPSRYQTWDWGSLIGSQVRVYAFMDNSFQDVTATYSAH